MNIIAWISFIFCGFSFITALVRLILGKDIVDRISNFISALLCAIPVYFFYVYLFR